MSGMGRRLDGFIARFSDASLPRPEDLPRYVAPLPTWLENLGLRLAWPIVLVNLIGTAFGFWYYRFQLAETDPLLWILVPDSPLATLFIGLSLAAWRLDLRAEWLHVLAFFGCIKLGGWTPFVQLVLQSPAGIALWLYWFLVLSHLSMIVEAFVIHRYARFPTWAVGVATVWYLGNDLVDYFVPVMGDVHHTWLRAEVVAGSIDHGIAAHDLAAAAAVVLTVAAVFLALVTRTEKLRRRQA